jgi:hypothetical protein
MVEKKLHTNAYEHTDILLFYKNCLLSGFLGLLLGALIEQSIKTIEDHTALKGQSRLECAGLLWIQLSFISFALYLGNSTPFIKKILYFDDWLMGTFAGFLFALTFINVQNRLSTNVTCLAFGPKFTPK